jgi:hypothetical protein
MTNSPRTSRESRPSDMPFFIIILIALILVVGWDSIADDDSPKANASPTPKRVALSARTCRAVIGPAPFRPVFALSPSVPQLQPSCSI